MPTDCSHRLSSLLTVSEDNEQVFDIIGAALFETGSPSDNITGFEYALFNTVPAGLFFSVKVTKSFPMGKVFIDIAGKTVFNNSVAKYDIVSQNQFVHGTPVCARPGEHDLNARGLFFSGPLLSFEVRNATSHKTLGLQGLQTCEKFVLLKLSNETKEYLNQTTIDSVPLEKVSVPASEKVLFDIVGAIQYNETRSEGNVTEIEFIVFDGVPSGLFFRIKLNKYFPMSDPVFSVRAGRTIFNNSIAKHIFNHHYPSDYRAKNSDLMSTGCRCVQDLRIRTHQVRKSGFSAEDRFSHSRLVSEASAILTAPLRPPAAVEWYFSGKAILTDWRT